MYRTVMMLRRNPAMTREEFIDYYETKHSKFITHWAIGGLIDIEHETDLSSPTCKTTYEAAKAKGK